MDKIEFTVNWNDTDFKRNRDFDSFCEDNRLTIAQQDSMITFCAVCGKIFLKKHHSEKYCCDECRSVARGQQSRNKAHRWYHKNKDKLSEKQRWGLGSGTLGMHSNKDFEQEQLTIQKEFSRLRLKRK